MHHHTVAASTGRACGVGRPSRTRREKKESCTASRLSDEQSRGRIKTANHTVTTLHMTKPPPISIDPRKDAK